MTAGSLLIDDLSYCGSVLHIFSHVKKTYATVVVDLTGSLPNHEEPVVNQAALREIDTQAEGDERLVVKKSKKRKLDVEEELRVRWVPEADVVNGKCVTRMNASPLIAADT